MNTKNLFTISVLLLSSLFTKAQFTSVIAEDTNIVNGETSIVRNLSSTEVITYHRDNKNGHFTYENNSTSLLYNSFDIAEPELYVLDFRIVNNLIYFCGVNTKTKYGFLGTFNVTNLQNATSAPVQYRWFDISSTTRLNRLVAYMDPSLGPRVVAVGYDGNGPCGVWACGVVVDCTNFLPSGAMPVSVNWRTAFYLTSSDHEIWEDVVITNNLVVLVGSGAMGGATRC